MSWKIAENETAKADGILSLLTCGASALLPDTYRVEDGDETRHVSARSEEKALEKAQNGEFLEEN